MCIRDRLKPGQRRARRSCSRGHAGQWPRSPFPRPTSEPKVLAARRRVLEPMGCELSSLRHSEKRA
eukprot:9168943-Alexandrium_andersonii.AAC.1